MAVKPLEWHKSNLKNNEAYLTRLRDEWVQVRKVFLGRINQAVRDADEYRKQIVLAEKEGRKVFDREKYNKRRLQSSESDDTYECLKNPLSHKLFVECGFICADTDLPEDEWCENCKAAKREVGNGCNEGND